MVEPTIDPAQCPLCAKPNACALVDGGKTCWCFSTPIDKTALQRVPPEQQGLVCVCRACGVSSEQQPQEPQEQQ